MEVNEAMSTISYVDVDNQFVDPRVTTATDRKINKENGAKNFGLVDLIESGMAELKARVENKEDTDRAVLTNGGHDNGISNDKPDIEEDANKLDCHRPVLGANESESVLNLWEEMKGLEIEETSMSVQDSDIEEDANSHDANPSTKDLAAELQQAEDGDDEDEGSDESIMSMESMEYIPPPPIVDTETLSPREANTMDVPVVVTIAHAVARKMVDRCKHPPPPYLLLHFISYHNVQVQD